MYILITSIVIGIIYGLLGGKVWILIPWGITAILIGYFSQKRRASLINGAVFGFLAVFFFMISGYAGAFPLITRLPYFAVIGLIGLVSGLAASFAGYIIHKGIRQK